MDPERDAGSSGRADPAGEGDATGSTLRAWRWWFVVLLGVMALAGLGLVLFAGDDPQEGSGTSSDNLDLGDTDAESVSAMAGLELPDSTSEFLTARLDDDSQLDVTFTIAPDDETAFIEQSGLAVPVPEQRVILHSSPLWELNTDGTIRGSTDTFESGSSSSEDSGADAAVRRSVELVEEGELVRVRLVITPA